MTTSTYVIVGAGFAGAKAAESLRAGGFDGRIVLVGAEQERPYERPPLSKQYLNGSKPRDFAYVHPMEWYDDNRVELLTSTRALGVDASEHRVDLSNGERLRFDKLLLVTGAEPRRLAIPGADLSGVHYLRRLDQADELISGLSSGGRRVVIVGGGWIGLEVAAAARDYSNHVDVIEPGPTVLRKALGDEMGSMFANLHRDHGVNLHMDSQPMEFAGESGRVVSVRLSTGVVLPSDVVVVGIGAAPNVELAENAGLAVDNGIVTDEYLRTSHPDIFAAGDVSNSFRPSLGRHLRVEHWSNAKDGGVAAGQLMLGRTEPFDPVPYFFTDQYDLGMEYSGVIGPEGYDRVVYRGDVDAREFIAFWLKDERMVAGMNVNVWDVSDDIQRLIRSRDKIDADALADPNTPVTEVVAR